MSTPGAGRDTVNLEELELFARVGVPEEERACAQRLTISLTLWPIAQFDELADQITNAVDYAAVARAVQVFVRQREDRLIETLAEAVASHLLEKYPIRRISVELRKYVLPEVKHVAVALTRDRPDRLVP